MWAAERLAGAQIKIGGYWDGVWINAAREQVYGPHNPSLPGSPIIDENGSVIRVEYETDVGFGKKARHDRIFFLGNVILEESDWDKWSGPSPKDKSLMEARLFVLTSVPSSDFRFVKPGRDDEIDQANKAIEPLLDGTAIEKAFPGSAQY